MIHDELGDDGHTGLLLLLMIYVRLLIIYNIMKLFLRTLCLGISRIDDGWIVKWRQRRNTEQCQQLNY